MKFTDYRKMLNNPNSIMVIIPHEDDEINTAGAFIYGARKSGIRVICVFITNGDWFYPGKVRIGEAIKSLQELGVEKEDIIFLGYPDGGPLAEQNVYAYGQRGNFVKTRQGISKTYGANGYEDFSYMERGTHQKYSWEDLLLDVEDVILRYHPDIIISTDMDFHPDHKMCTIAVNFAVSKILNKKDNQYYPKILKGFAYNTAYTGIDDLQNANLLSTKYNLNKLWNTTIDTDNPEFVWNERIRFPVVEECQNSLLCQNPIYWALSAHISQRAFERAGRIINGDQVFWKKRTDNLAFQGNLEASSGEIEYLHDFQTVRFQNISSRIWSCDKYLWRPDINDKEKWCRCTFNEPRNIQEVVLYGNVAGNERILKGEFLFSNGNKYIVGPVKKWGQPTRYKMPLQQNIMWVQFRILEMESPEAGIAEWEIFGSDAQDYRILHILCNGHFAYKWYKKKTDILDISVYKHGIKSNLKWLWNGELSTLDEIRSRCNYLKGPVIIRVEAIEDPQLFDEVLIKPWGIKNAIGLIGRNWLNYLTIKYVRFKQKPAHHRAKILAQALISEK